MLKRLIEVALPLKEVSEQSAREKSIRHGHISTLHIWWARRPLAACRAVVFASLIPDPDDPECPDSFPALVNDLLPKTPNGEDTPRNRCLEFIKHLVKWENSNNDEIIGKARKLIAAAHKFLHPDLPAPRPDTFWVYVLKCNDDSFYIGQTDDIPRRWKEHWKGEVSWTKPRLGVTLIHYESFPTREEAVKREKDLKTGFGRKWLKREYEAGRLASRQAGAEGDSPKVLDPFAGGGAIPLETLRLGCEAHAIDLNPVAHLIELCTLVYPQKYGQPNSRPTPDYIMALEAAHRGEQQKKQQEMDFDRSADGGLPSEIDGIALTRLPVITEAEYQKNPLAADVKFWGDWVLEKARDEIGQFYPPDPDGSIPVAYLWARTVKCPNPACGATLPLVKQFCLCKKADRLVAIRMIPDLAQRRCRFAVAENKDVEFDYEVGTIQRGNATCPFCHQVAPVEYMREECRAGRMAQQLMTIVTVKAGVPGKRYREPTAGDENTFADAVKKLDEARTVPGNDIFPEEPLPPVGTLGFRVNNYGLLKWGDLFNPRQALALGTFGALTRRAAERLAQQHESEYGKAVGTLLGVCVSRLADFGSSLCVFNYTGGRGVKNTFGRQALPMVWDYAESAPFNEQGANWQAGVEASWETIRKITMSEHAEVVRGSATGLAVADARIHAIVTDPPYYDAIPYADLSDFFYVWLKRAIRHLHSDTLRTPLSPKQQELVSHLPNASRGQRMNAAEYEAGMRTAFSEMQRVLADGGVGCVMFAHKTTSAWETIIAGMIQSGLSVTSSWPFHTERPGRLRAQESAALASSVTLVFRKRLVTADEGYWDDVRDELREVSRERLDFFWQQGIRGADFFISAIGPALSVYGRYAKVTRLTGEEVSVGQFLDEVRGIVTDYALSQILHGAKTGQIDSETRFYVLWNWSYGDGKVPADEAFKLAQALGIDTEEMWDRTGVLEKQGQNVQALTVAKRMRIKDLGEPNVDGSPATLIDTLHRCCAFRDKGDTGGLSEYLARSGHGRNEKLWTVAQAISEVLPDGDKEKQLLQGLLNQRDKVEEEMKEGRLF